ncbi:hypothetical protein T484DRAFT_1754519 [Baffinella frigidus]|nr:hypothetical protein T484DRAFT_1754519 [Cryptophyta sp. CCMP2293]
MVFAANLHSVGGGIRRPDVVINGAGGSLLPNGGGGVRFPASRINEQQKALLSRVVPYQYGQGSGISVSDDIAYQTTPHKIQKIVPPILLPSSKSDIGSDNLLLSHGVDDGDLAFTIRATPCFFAKQNLPRTVDPIVNLATVNYILRGLQTKMGTNSGNWALFLKSTGWPIGEPNRALIDFQAGRYQHRNISMFVQDYIRPLGVVIGSEHQGGQHQGQYGGAVDYPVDYVVTILVDGLCDNMLNLWRRTEINAGDDLMLALCGCAMQHHDIKTTGEGGKPIRSISVSKGPMGNQFSVNGGGPGINVQMYTPPAANTLYVLNHWAKGTVQARFLQSPNILYELVPTTSSEIDEGSFLGDDRRNRGVWHIARSQVQASSRNNASSFRNDTANLAMGAGLVQSTIAPVWKSAAAAHRKSAAAAHRCNVPKQTIVHTTPVVDIKTIPTPSIQHPTPGAIPQRSTVHATPIIRGSELTMAVQIKTKEKVDPVCVFDSLLSCVARDHLIKILGTPITPTRQMTPQEVYTVQSIMKTAANSLQTLKMILVFAKLNEWGRVVEIITSLSKDASKWYTTDGMNHVPVYTELICENEVEVLYRDALQRQAASEARRVPQRVISKTNRSALQINAFPFICVCYVYFLNATNTLSSELEKHMQIIMTNAVTKEVQPLSDTSICQELYWCLQSLAEITKRKAIGHVKFPSMFNPLQIAQPPSMFNPLQMAQPGDDSFNADDFRDIVDLILNVENGVHGYPGSCCAQYDDATRILFLETVLRDYESGKDWEKLVNGVLHKIRTRVLLSKNPEAVPSDVPRPTLRPENIEAVPSDVPRQTIRPENTEAVPSDVPRPATTPPSQPQQPIMQSEHGEKLPLPTFSNSEAAADGIARVDPESHGIIRPNLNTVKEKEPEGLMREDSNDKKVDSFGNVAVGEKTHENLVREDSNDKKLDGFGNAAVEEKEPGGVKKVDIRKYGGDELTEQLRDQLKALKSRSDKQPSSPPVSTPPVSTVPDSLFNMNDFLKLINRGDAAKSDMSLPHHIIASHIVQQHLAQLMSSQAASVASPGQKRKQRDVV